MQPFTERVIEQVRNIPEGSVMTYGQIAALAGSPKGARQVVRILHAMSRTYNLPWHRVVNAQGEIALQEEPARSLQIQCLEHEGVIVNERGQIDLTKFRYTPQRWDD